MQPNAILRGYITAGEAMLLEEELTNALVDIDETLTHEDVNSRFGNRPTRTVVFTAKDGYETTFVYYWNHELPNHILIKLAGGVYLKLLVR